ncbi:MAG: hypothetical protein RJQ14_04910 [Marinoscillum sp.]
MRLIWLIALTSFFVSCDQINSVFGTTESDSGDENVVKKYYDNGKLKSIYQINDLRQKHGQAKVYNSKGELKQSFQYENGEKIQATSHYPNGKPLMQIDYKNGVKDGFIRRYYEDGTMESETPYKEDYAGKGLKEYMKSGKLKEKYPKLIVRGIDQVKVNGKYIIEVYFDSNPGRGTYYIGELTEGKYMNYRIDELERTNYRGRIEFAPAPGVMIMEKLTFVGEYKTPTGNKYIVDEEFNLAIDNSMF